MSFDDHLPTSLVSKLYKDVLYTTKTLGIINAEKPVSFKSVLGGNKKRILIIVSYEDVPVIEDKPLKFLLEILSACKLTLDDVIIINQATNRLIPFEKVVAEFSSQIILAFSIKPQDLNLRSELVVLSIYQINNNKLLLSPSLDAIEIDLPLKKQFWLALRKLFEV